MKTLKWQERFKYQIDGMSDRELFDSIVFDYSCQDRHVQRDMWKFDILFQLFTERMGWH